MRVKEVEVAPLKMGVESRSKSKMYAMVAREKEQEERGKRERRIRVSGNPVGK